MAESKSGNIKEIKKTQTELALLAEKAKKFDSHATQEKVISDLRTLAKNNPDKFITRNFYRIHGTYSDKTWEQFFGTMEEFRSQAGLQLTRPQRHLERHIAKHAALEQYRQFYREEVEPWVNKYNKQSTKPDSVKKVIVCSDIHDVEVDLFVLSVFLKTCEREQPDVIVLAGDIFDCYEFSHFNKDPRKTNLRKRFQFVHQFILAPLRAVCPDAQIDFIIGNHEQRILKHLAAGTPNMMALLELNGLKLTDLLGLDKFQINLVTKMDFSAYKINEIRDELQKNYKIYYDTLVVNHAGDENFGLCTIGGHLHNPRMVVKYLPIKGPIFNLTLGCMCKVDADYVQSKCEWQQSFAIAYIMPEEERCTVNHVMFAENFVNVNGIYYMREQEEHAQDKAAKAVEDIKACEIKAFMEKM